MKLINNRSQIDFHQIGRMSSNFSGYFLLSFSLLAFLLLLMFKFWIKFKNHSIKFLDFFLPSSCNFFLCLSSFFAIDINTMRTHDEHFVCGLVFEKQQQPTSWTYFLGLTFVFLIIFKNQLFLNSICFRISVLLHFGKLNNISNYEHA